MNSAYFLISPSLSSHLRTKKDSGIGILEAEALERSALVRLIGGKGAGLSALENTGLSVPPWGVISSDFCGSLIQDSSDLVSEIKQQGGDSLLGLYRLLSHKGRYPLAVRSSAVDEDDFTHSNAGRFLSVMGVKSYIQFLQAVSDVVESADKVRRKSMAVLVQRFIQPRCSGVAFSLDPVTGNRNNLSISGVPGHAGKLVSGEWQGDSFLFDSFGKELIRSIIEKEQKLSYGRNPEDVIKALSGRKSKKPCFTRRDLKKIYHAVRYLDDVAGYPVDMEFLFHRKRLYLVQMRPVTTRASSDSDRSNYRVWDNSNIVESYAGITLPLTFSYVRFLYSVVYKQFFKSIAIPQRVIDYYNDIYPQMLGYFKGRIFYNLINWYLIVAELPGFKKNKGYMELMMGVGKTLHHIPAHPKKGLAKYLFYLPRGILTTLLLAGKFLFMTPIIKAFVKRFDQHYEGYRKLDLHSLTSSDFMALADKVEKEILSDWKAPIINDVKAMILYGILKDMTKRYFDPSVGTLHNRLLANQGGLISVKAVEHFQSLADEISGSEALSKLFELQDNRAIDQKLKEEPAFKEFNRRFREYLHLYGQRSVEELKLETIPNRESPEFCLQMLKNSLSGETQNAAENNDKAVLKTIGPIRRGLYRFVIRQTGNAIRDREEQRFRRSCIFDFMREAFTALGQRWELKQILTDSRDIHYLTIDEIRSFINGTGVDGSLKNIIERRKKEFEDYRKEDLPNRFITFGESCNAEIIDDSAAPGEGPIVGEGCSPGIVVGTVVILEKPEADTELQGEIVVARQTDPGWAIIYPAISGLLVERGSTLSHSAIVAREMGLPAIMGLAGITSRLKNGQRIRMNGATGTVEVLD